MFAMDRHRPFVPGAAATLDRCPTTRRAPHASRRLALLHLALQTTLLAACSADRSTGVQEASSTIVPESRGQALVAGVLTPATRLWWGRGDEITYTGLDLFGVSAQVRRINVADGRMTVIDSFPSRAIYGGPWVSRDGLHIFFQRSGALYHATGTEAPMLVTRTGGFGFEPPNSPNGGALAATGAGNQVAYVSLPDSLWVYDVLARSSRFVSAGCPRLVTASPDGTEALCRRMDETFAIVNTGTGVSTPAQGVTAPFSGIRLIYWTVRGIEYVRGGQFWFVELVNAASGTTTTVVPPTPPDASRLTFEALDFNSLTWSHDGRKIAYARNLCDAVGFECTRRQTQLFVFDVESNVTTRVAAVGPEIGSMTFAPDGRRLAYMPLSGTSASTLYIVSVP